MKPKRLIYYPSELQMLFSNQLKKTGGMNDYVKLKKSLKKKNELFLSFIKNGLKKLKRKRKFSNQE